MIRRIKQRDTSTVKFACPYCSERLTLPVDRSAGSTQQFIYDCEICCKPIVVELTELEIGFSVFVNKES
jgi:hypothetical protein